MCSIQNVRIWKNYAFHDKVKSFIFKNNYTKKDIETKKNMDSLLSDKEDIQLNINKIKIYEFNEIIDLLINTSLFIIILLFILRPTFSIVISIFNETK